MLPDMVYGFLKASLDAHTMGVLAASDLLRDCGYRVVIGDRRFRVLWMPFSMRRTKRR